MIDWIRLLKTISIIMGMFWLSIGVIWLIMEFEAIMRWVGALVLTGVFVFMLIFLVKSVYEFLGE